MEHRDAIQESSVEQYLLGELSGTARDRFEEHLFECLECAADLRSGVTLLETSREELAATRSRESDRHRGRFTWLLSPLWLAPALAACLLVIAYETAVVVPRARHELAQANAPAVLNTVTLATGTERALSVRQIQAPSNGSFLISFDIPAQTGFSAYRCSLFSPSGSLVWQGEVSPEQARDTVELRVPTAATSAGMNHLLVQGRNSSGSSGGTLVDLSKYQFLVNIDK